MSIPDPWLAKKETQLVGHALYREYCGLDLFPLDLGYQDLSPGSDLILVLVVFVSRISVLFRQATTTQAGTKELHPCQRTTGRLQEP